VRKNIRPPQRDGLERRDHGDRLGGGPVGRQVREVAVVAGGQERATDGRGDQAAGDVGGVECRSKHRRHVLGDERDAKGEGVDAVHLRVLDETAEAAVALVEERLHGVDGSVVGEHDLAPHRAEGAHDPPLWTEKPPPDGPIDPDPKSNPELLLDSPSSLEKLCRVTFGDAALVPGCAARAAKTKSANPAAAQAPIPNRARLRRRRASSMREGCPMPPS
jgi:hypothetical protein